MTEFAVTTNGYFWFVMLTVVGFFLLDLFANWLNVHALKERVPDEFTDVFDAEKYAKSQAYTRATTRFGMLESALSLLIFVVFWCVGGFGWMDHLVRGWVSSEILRGLIYVGLLFVAGQLINLPFQLYDTFVIEERFGFNKTTLQTFILDHVKSLVLSVLIGAPLMAVIFYLFERFDTSAWLYGWIAVASFSVLLSYLAPPLILPLFYKLTPLGEGELKTAIQAMSQKCAFPLQEVYEIDGSTRSTKSNAFFTGFGKNKRIALYDTLIKNHSVGELVAVLAHEIGHFRRRHIIKNLVLGIIQMGIMFFLIGLFLNNRGLFDAFGVQELSVYASLVLFFMLYEPISKLLSVGMMMLSRRHEFEADAYAAEVTGAPDDLVKGLKKLAEHNLSNLTPHPFFVFVNYSHPPLMDRIAALRSLA
ncbi:MAG: M48 family metallopeptidase [Planctomycetota bacterium]